MQYTIDNGTLCVSVDALGAQIKSVKYNGKQRAWQNDNGAWKDTAPLLFPICGHFDVTVDGVSYPMPAHGFVKKLPFTLVEQTPNALTLECSACEQTKSVYPFEFTFRVTYHIDGGKLTVEYAVKNNGSTPLSFACGGHDSFVLDCDVDAYQLVFDKKETLTHYAHDDDGYLTGETACYGKDVSVLCLPKDYLAEGRTLIFGGIQSRKVTLQTTQGKPLAYLTFEGFENLLIWRATADSKYVCIEPWTNLPDPIHASKSEFSQKAGVYSVAAGEEKVLTRVIEYV